MATAENPYAPSRASLAGSEVRAEARLWRLNKLLIMSREGDLPPRCVKCNETSDEPRKTHTLYWHHPGFYVVLLINVLLYLIVAVIARKTAKVSPGLCALHKQRRMRGVWISWAVFLGSFLFMAAAFRDGYALAGLIAILVMFASILACSLFSRTVHAKRIDDRYIQLKGCGEAFLEELPEYRQGAHEL